MKLDTFWDIIDRSRPSEDANPEDCQPRLIELLAQLPADEIVEWNHLFDQLARDACTVDQLAACWWINGGAGDDGFYYYRCWLIGRGRACYESALANPDTLVDFVSEDDDAEAEIYAAAHIAWMQVTGNPDTAPYPARKESAELKGEHWDFEDEDEMRRRMPRLAAKYVE